MIDLGNVMTRSGWMMEVFRTDWPALPIAVQQVNWVQLAPGAVTDWHRHSNQTDHLIGIGGNIKLALWDGRDDSPRLRHMVPTAKRQFLDYLKNSFRAEGLRLRFDDELDAVLTSRSWRMTAPFRRLSLGVQRLIGGRQR